MYGVRDWFTNITVIYYSHADHGRRLYDRAKTNVHGVCVNDIFEITAKTDHQPKRQGTDSQERVAIITPIHVYFADIISTNGSCTTNDEAVIFKFVR